MSSPQVEILRKTEKYTRTRDLRGIRICARQKVIGGAMLAFRGKYAAQTSEVYDERITGGRYSRSASYTTTPAV